MAITITDASGNTRTQLTRDDRNYSAGSNYGQPKSASSYSSSGSSATQSVSNPTPAVQSSPISNLQAAPQDNNVNVVVKDKYGYTTYNTQLDKVKGIFSDNNGTLVSTLPGNAKPSDINRAITGDVGRINKGSGGGTYYSKAQYPGVASGDDSGLLVVSNSQEERAQSSFATEGQLKSGEKDIWLTPDNKLASSSGNSAPFGLSAWAASDRGFKKIPANDLSFSPGKVTYNPILNNQTNASGYTSMSGEDYVKNFVKSDRGAFIDILNQQSVSPSQVEGMKQSTWFVPNEAVNQNDNFNKYFNSTTIYGRQNNQDKEVLDMGVGNLHSNGTSSVDFLNGWGGNGGTSVLGALGRSYMDWSGENYNALKGFTSGIETGAPKFIENTSSMIKEKGYLGAAAEGGSALADIGISLAKGVFIEGRYTTEKTGAWQVMPDLRNRMEYFFNNGAPPMGTSVTQGKLPGVSKNYSDTQGPTKLSNALNNANGSTYNLKLSGVSKDYSDPKTTETFMSIMKDNSKPITYSTLPGVSKDYTNTGIGDSIKMKINNANGQTYSLKLPGVSKDYSNLQTGANMTDRSWNIGLKGVSKNYSNTGASDSIIQNVNASNGQTYSLKLPGVSKDYSNLQTTERISSALNGGKGSSYNLRLSGISRDYSDPKTTETFMSIMKDNSKPITYSTLPGISRDYYYVEPATAAANAVNAFSDYDRTVPIYDNPDVRNALVTEAFIAGGVGALGSAGKLASSIGEKAVGTYMIGEAITNPTSKNLAYASLPAAAWGSKGFQIGKERLQTIGAEYIPPEKVYNAEALVNDKGFSTTGSIKEIQMQFEATRTHNYGLTTADSMPKTVIGVSKTGEIIYGTNPIKALKVSDESFLKGSNAAGDNALYKSGVVRGDMNKIKMQDPGEYITAAGEASPRFHRIGTVLPEEGMSGTIEVSLNPFKTSKPNIVNTSFEKLMRYPKGVLDSAAKLPEDQKWARIREYQQTRVGKGEAYITARREWGDTHEGESHFVPGEKFSRTETLGLIRKTIGGDFKQYTTFRGRIVPLREFKLLKTAEVNSASASGKSLFSEKMKNEAYPDAVGKEYYKPQPVSLGGRYKAAQSGDYLSNYKPAYSGGYSPKYQPKYSPNYQSKYSTNYSPKYTPNYNPRYTPTYTSGYKPNYKPTYKTNYSPNYSPEYNPNYKPNYKPKYNPEYNPSYTPPYMPNYFKASKVNNSQVMSLSMGANEFNRSFSKITDLFR